MEFSKWTPSLKIAFLLLSIANIITAQSKTCGVRDIIPYELPVPTNHSTTTPFLQVKSYGVALVALSTSGGCNPFSVTFSVDDQLISFYVNERYENYWNADRGYYGYYGPSLSFWMRCFDGSDTSTQFTVRIIDPIRTAPYFSSSKYTYSVDKPWPASIPITHDFPIWARDINFQPNLGDYYYDEFGVYKAREKIQVKFSVDQPEVVSVRNTTYANKNEAEDYKLDLFLDQKVAPGTYLIILTANDGTFTVNTTINLIVDEPSCSVI